MIYIQHLQYNRNILNTIKTNMIELHNFHHELNKKRNFTQNQIFRLHFKLYNIYQINIIPHYPKVQNKNQHNSETPHRFIHQPRPYSNATKLQKDTRPSHKYIRGFSAIELFKSPSGR